MPYIPQECRPELDEQIDKLVEVIVKQHKGFGYDGAFAGLLNYTVTTMTLKILDQSFGPFRYWQNALVRGVFDDISTEFYRRKSGPYEDEAVKKNGDCY